jgi:hypothetical protein
MSVVYAFAFGYRQGSLAPKPAASKVVIKQEAGAATPSCKSVTTPTPK